MAAFPSSLTDFKPLRVLGSGGFGQVWLAKQTSLDREVAIKVGLSPLASPDSRQRFERECKALGRLTNHRNIVDVYTSGFTDDELPFIVMEYIDGGTLKDRAGHTTEAELLQIADQLCDGLQAAHDAGVLHRDLKPENIFLRKNGEVVVGDFGIARLSELGITATGAIPATIAYAAPETLSGFAPTPATDVYGIAITLITTKLGKNPYQVDDTDSIPALLNRVISEPIPDLTTHFSNPVAACLTHATSKDPTHRISTAQELRANLTSSPQRASNTNIDVHNQTTGDVQHRNPQAPNIQTVASLSSPHQVQQSYPNPGFQTPPFQPTAPKSRSRLYIGAALTAAALLTISAVFIVSGLSKGSPTAATEPTSTPTTAQTTTTTEPTVPELPLALPLHLEDYVAATGLPRNVNGLEPLNGPANGDFFCNIRPSIDGLEETVAELYEPEPPGPTFEGVSSQRAMRFADADAAGNHLQSLVETSSCGEWLEVVSEGGPSTFQAEQTDPAMSLGDELVQIDSVFTEPSGIKNYVRQVSVRRGRDVIRISHSTFVPQSTHTGADALAARAVEILDS